LEAAEVNGEMMCRANKPVHIRIGHPRAAFRLRALQMAIA
jgi:hypothetical protein